MKRKYESIFVEFPGILKAVPLKSNVMFPVIVGLGATICLIEMLTLKSLEFISFMVGWIWTPPISWFLKELKVML